MGLAKFFLIYSSLCTVCFLPFHQDERLVVRAESFIVNKKQDKDADRSKRTASVIRNTSQANAYMMRYGYLKCKQNKHPSFHSRLNRQHGRPGSVQHQQILYNCDKMKVMWAIRQYQKSYHLPVTGRLNQETKELMSASRCGNKDKDDGYFEDEQLNFRRKHLRSRGPRHGGRGGRGSQRYEQNKRHNRKNGSLLKRRSKRDAESHWTVNAALKDDEAVSRQTPRSVSSTVSPLQPALSSSNLPINSKLASLLVATFSKFRATRGRWKRNAGGGDNGYTNVSTIGYTNAKNRASTNSSIKSIATDAESA
ncbi:hypothetical protein Ahia01_000677500, partial [Argonauta hians]